MTRLLLALTLCLMGSTLTAQILINEISAANMSGLLDGDGDREDWVELYNPGPAAVNIGGWFLSDNPNNPQKWVIPVGQNIPAGAYRVVFCSGKDKVAPPYLHTNFKLSQTKGESLISKVKTSLQAEAISSGSETLRAAIFQIFKMALEW